MTISKKSIIAAVTLTAATLSAQAATYKVTANLSEDENGLTAYIVNYDNGNKIDSVVVADNQAIFTGDINDALLARLIIDGNRYGTFILEEGDITMSNGEAIGTPLNYKMKTFNAQAEAIGEVFQNAQTDGEKRAIYGVYNDLVQETCQNNIDNPIGYYLFIQSAYEMSLQELQAALEKTPSLKKYERVNKLVEAMQRKELTSVGHKFADFEITYNGKTERLSDYVGNGKYVIVDFWASWCGPCIRQAAVLKEIYNEYHSQGLEVLGVAVWDEPENTLEAIESHGLPWHNILNAQNIPTDLYGISGIPCIILFGPDGTILSRDKQGDELKEDVRKAMTGELK